MKRFLSAFFLLLLNSAALSALEVPPDDPNIQIENAAFTEIEESRMRKKILHMNRGIPHPVSAHNGSPGAVIRFKTDAKSVKVNLVYSKNRPQKIPTNSKGLYFVNGKTSDDWVFDRKTTLPLRLPADGSMKEYEIVMPLADSVDFCGLTLSNKPEFQVTVPRKKRIVFYGNDLISGKAESIEKTFPFLFSRLKQYEAVNMGFSGIRLTPWHAEFLAKIKMDALVVLIGRHDAKVGTPLPVFTKNIERFIEEFQRKKPRTELIFIAPFQCNAKQDMIAYRNVILSTKGERIRVLDGMDLVSGDISFFESDMQHLNEAGVIQFSENLAKKL